MKQILQEIGTGRTIIVDVPAPAPSRRGLQIMYIAAADLAPGKEFVYVDAALKGQQAGHMVPWVVCELSTGAIVGSTRFHDIVREIDRVGVGYTFYAKRWQRTHVNDAWSRGARAASHCYTHRSSLSSQHRERHLAIPDSSD